MNPLVLLTTGTLVLTGCTSTSTPAAAPTVTGAAVSSSSSTGSAVTTSSTAPASPTSVPAAASSSSGPVPADVTRAGSAGLAAWEALMGADGEYAASAAYQGVIDRYGQVEPYVSIKAGEDRHVQALTRQLERMGVTVPANPYLGSMTAPASLKQAAQAWADGEVANVALYDDLMAKAASDPALTRVFTNLRRASQEEHLPMFTEAAAGDGTLSTGRMAQLKKVHQRAGGGHGNGNGAGNGPGAGPGGGAGQGAGQGAGRGASAP